MKIHECVISLFIGIGVFILAMRLMTDTLNEIAGERMRYLIKRLTSNRISGVLVGALVTAVIQSSSATTVMVLGFINVNVMTLEQAAAIIIGANIGTTITAFIASLESLNIALYLSLLVFIGVFASFIKKVSKVGNLLTGLGMIFVGLRLMSGAFNDEGIKKEFEKVLKKISFPLLLELLGIVLTALMQSSSAMTGIIIIMVSKKIMTLSSALFILLGTNVGTCVTALFGIIGGNTNSKRTAVIHFTFNVFGLLLFTPIVWIFRSHIEAFLKKLVSKEAMQLAFFHLFFNIITAIIVIPLINYLVKMTQWLIKEDNPEEEVFEEIIASEEKFECNQI